MVTIQSVTLAATNVEAMVAFYNGVLGCDLHPIANAPNFYRGKLGQLDMVVCPNTVANVVAEQNRQQLGFVVEDVLGVLKSAESHPTQRMGDPVATPNGLRAYLRDPDGNTLELIEATPTPQSPASSHP